MGVGDGTARCAGAVHEAAGPGYDPKQKGFYERTKPVPVLLCSAKIATSSGANYLVLPHY